MQMQQQLMQYSIAKYTLLDGQWKFESAHPNAQGLFISHEIVGPNDWAYGT